MSAPDSTPQTAPEIQREIERTRERLGQTVEELTAKADVKTRARVKAAEASEWVRRNQAVRRDWPLAMVAAGILVMGAALVRRRRTT